MEDIEDMDIENLYTLDLRTLYADMAPGIPINLGIHHMDSARVR